MHTSASHGKLHQSDARGLLTCRDAAAKRPFLLLCCVAIESAAAVSRCRFRVVFSADKSKCTFWLAACIPCIPVAAGCQAPGSCDKSDSQPSHISECIAEPHMPGQQHSSSLATWVLHHAHMTISSQQHHQYSTQNRHINMQMTDS